MDTCKQRKTILLTFLKKYEKLVQGQVISDKLQGSSSNKDVIIIIIIIIIIKIIIIIIIIIVIIIIIIIIIIVKKGLGKYVEKNPRSGRLWEP